MKINGIGLVDAHLLASCLLNQGVALSTRDIRLKTGADEIGAAIHA